MCILGFVYVHAGVVVGGSLGLKTKKHPAGLLVRCEGATLPG